MVEKTAIHDLIINLRCNRTIEFGNVKFGVQSPSPSSARGFYVECHKRCAL